MSATNPTAAAFDEALNAHGTPREHAVAELERLGLDRPRGRARR